MSENNQKKIELKPCPFCGGEVKIEVNASIFCAVVKCEQCHVKMKSIYGLSKNIEELLLELMANDWNRRADDGK